MAREICKCSEYLFSSEGYVLRDKFLSNVDISDDLLSLIPKENKYIAYLRYEGAYFFIHPDSREKYVFATEEDMEYLNEKYYEIEWADD